MSNPQLYGSLICPIDATAALPSISFGGGPNSNSGTGIYGTYGHVKVSVNGSLVADITPSGIDAVIVGQTILALPSSASLGGTATEVLTVTGLLTSDTILSVTQKTPGANSLPLLGYSTQAANALTVIYSADPGVGAIIVVAVKR